MSRSGSKTKLKGKAAKKDSGATENGVSKARFVRTQRVVIRCHRNRTTVCIEWGGWSAVQYIPQTKLADTNGRFSLLWFVQEAEVEVVPQLAWRVIDEETTKHLRELSVEDVAK